MRKKVRFKEFCFAKQGLYKLKAKEAKKDCSLKVAETAYILVVASPNNLAYLLPLTNSFIFSSFLILPNPFSFNTPIPFL